LFDGCPNHDPLLRHLKQLLPAIKITAAPLDEWMLRAPIPTKT
jgi:hypothetical protein